MYVQHGESLELVGFFSKEKISEEDNNLACILTFRNHQAHGYGSLMIEFSYLLSKLEHKPGHPERPLSALGERGYVSYWCNTLLLYLSNHIKDDDAIPSAMIYMSDMAYETGVDVHDLLWTIDYLHLTEYRKDDGSICILRRQLDKLLREKTLKPKRVDKTKLVWEQVEAKKP